MGREKTTTFINIKSRFDFLLKKRADATGQPLTPLGACNAALVAVAEEFDRILERIEKIESQLPNTKVYNDSLDKRGL